MNKLIFFKSLEKAVKELPLDDQKLIIKEYEFRYQQEKIKGIKDKDIIATFGTPAEIIEAYLANKNEVLVNLNTELTTSDDSTDYAVEYEAAKDELITEKEENSEKEDAVVEVNPNLEITPFVEEVIVVDEIKEEVTEENEKAVEEIKEETISEETVVEVNPNLEIEIPVKEETEVKEKTEEKEIDKKKKSHKKIPILLIPLWLILIVIVLALDLLIGLLYVPLVFVGFGIFLFGIYTIVGSIMLFLSVSIFNGLFQAGIGVLIIILSVVFISLVNLMLKSTWKLLGRMFKMMRGK